MRRILFITCAFILVLSSIAAPLAARAQDKFVVGFILIGPQTDKGWSEAHFHAAEYVEQKVPGVTKIILDKMNSADRPNSTIEQVVDNMVAEGAKMIFTTSDEMGADTLAVAKKYPDVIFIHVSGDSVFKGDAPANLGNVMGKMELGKMIGGCAAALKTEKGSIAYLGPLINDETRRLASSAFLGAKYCYEKYRGKDPKTLKFEVRWIGFWFNIPGVTLDPNEVANSFFDGGVDVILSGIDTPEASTVAGQRAEKGEKVWVVPYDYKSACDLVPDICLGVPYFNWGPAYVKLVEAAKAGTWKQAWEWNAPYWEDINDPDKTAVGFEFGKALTEDDRAKLDEFIKGLADGSVSLFKGPLNFQDGTTYLKADEVATDKQIWYLTQLLEGMTGASANK